MVRTDVRRVASLRGMTLSDVSRGLEIYLSNLSAMDAGKRSVSLKKLSKIAQFLHCSVGDLIVNSGREGGLFQKKALDKAVRRIEESYEDGTDKSWVPKVTLSFMRHYARSRKKT